MATRLQNLATEPLMIDGYQASKGAQLLLELRRRLRDDPSFVEQLARAIDFQGDILELAEKVAYYLPPSVVTIREQAVQLDKANPRV